MPASARRYLGWALGIIWLYGLLSGQPWGRNWIIPFIAFSLIGTRDEEEEGGESSATPKPMTENQRAFLAMLPGGLPIPPVGLEDEAEPQFVMSDADYGRIAMLIQESVPHIPPHFFYRPEVRREIEQRIIEGGSLAELTGGMDLLPHSQTLPLGRQFPAGRSMAPGEEVVLHASRPLARPRSTSDQRLNTAHAENRARLRAIQAALPQSQNGKLFFDLQKEKALRQFQPEEALVEREFQRGSPVLRHARVPSRFQRQYRLAMRRRLHSSLRELQPVQAPPAKATADGRLTGAPLNLRTAPPRYVR